MQTPAGWYPDPLGRFDHRYWDGERWTDHVSRAGQTATDPVDGSPATDERDDVAAEPAAGLTTDATTDAPTEFTTESATEPATPDLGATAEPATVASGATVTGGSSEATWATPGAEQAPPSSWPSTPSTPPAGTPPPAGDGGWGPPQAGATPPYQPGAVPGERRTNVMAVLSLVFSLIWVLGLGSLAAIVLGALGIKRINASGGRETGKGLAIAGIVLGALGLISTVLFFAGLAVFARDAGIQIDPSGEIVFDDSALFEDAEWARWTALYDTAAAEENHWYVNERYTSDLSTLESEGLVLEPGTELFIPTATSDTFCIELTDSEGIWHLDNDFYEVEEGPCPLG